MRLLFDIETNGLLDKLDKIHSLVITDVDTGETGSFADQEGYRPIAEGLEWLKKATTLIGHNIIRFDLPALDKLFPDLLLTADAIDTFIMSLLIWPEIKISDFDRWKKDRDKFPGHLLGSHGLEAWGRRLGLYKGDYSKDRRQQLIDLHVEQGKNKPTKEEFDEFVWGVWSKSMQDYCELDVQLNLELWNRIDKKNYSPIAIEMENKFAHILFLQEQHGFQLDQEVAEDLYKELAARRQELTDELQKFFPPWEVRTPFLPKANNKKYGYVKGEWTEKVKTVVFNPGSRDHIALVLKQKYGWKPRAFTDKGKPQIDETVLSAMDFEEAPLLNEYLMITKRIGQVSEGKNAWLKLSKNGRIHGRVKTAGAVTRRCTHSNPNVAQTPKSTAPYGHQCRSCFKADDGHVLVGADASGLELRVLAHYMSRFDKGKYVKELLEGDIHTLNQVAAGLPDRDSAKTFIYAFLYGAGGYKLGTIAGVTPNEIKVFPDKYRSQLKRAKRELDYLGLDINRKNVCLCIKGYLMKDSFLKKTPALKKLQDKVQEKVKATGKLQAVDGGLLTVRSKHSALNTLLQSAGSIVVKKATVLLYDDLCTRGWVWGKDWAQVAHIHDEIQATVRPDYADEFGKAAVQAIRDAGVALGFRCPLDGEFKIGSSWADTH